MNKGKWECQRGEEICLAELTPGKKAFLCIFIWEISWAFFKVSMALTYHPKIETHLITFIGNKMLVLLLGQIKWRILREFHFPILEDRKNLYYYVQ